MIMEELLRQEWKKGFIEINVIRESGVRSFLDDWLVLEMIGRGASGCVYRIIKPQEGVTGQQCALKISQVYTADDAKNRQREIETQRMLSGHPNAVQIEDYALVSIPGGSSFTLMRMELLEQLPEDGLSEREVIKLGTDICSVLQECARTGKGIVHCDIKPANILRSDKGIYKLGDFGTAKTLRGTMTYNGGGGTPLYMSPEMLDIGKGYDTRSDIYSLGLTMYTLLNGGKHPFDVEDRTDGERPIKKLPSIPGTSAGLMRIIRKMCAYDPSSRYRYAGECKADLEKYSRRLTAGEQKQMQRREQEDAISRQKRLEEHAAAAKAADHAAEEKRRADDAFDEASRKLREAERDTDSSGRRYLALRRAEEKARTEAEKAGDELDRAREAVRLVAEEKLSYSEARRRAYNVPEPSPESHAVEHYNDAVPDDYDDYYDADDGIHVSGSGNTTRPSILRRVAVAAAAVLLTVSGIAVSVMFIYRMIDRMIEVRDGTSAPVSAGLPELDERSGEDVVSGGDFDTYEDGDTSEESVTLAYPLMDSGDFKYFVNERSEAEVVSYSGIFASVVIPSELNGFPVTSVYDSAFAKSTIEEVSVPAGVTTIGDSAFSGCPNLKKVYLHEGIVSLGSSAFRNCTSLTAPDLPQSLTFIGDDCFNGCEQFDAFYLPENVEHIGEKAFAYCDKLSVIGIPASVTTIGDGVFQRCPALSEISLSEENICYKLDRYGVLYTYDMSELICCPAMANLPGGVFTVPSSVRRICPFAFSVVRTAKTVKIADPSSDEERVDCVIDSSAFQRCRSVKEIYISSRVTSIGLDAFTYCQLLKRINVSSDNAKFSSEDGVLFNKDKTVLIKYPANRTQRTYNVPGTVKTVNNSSFISAIALRNVVIPEGAVAIGSDAFHHCSALESVRLPESLSTIGSDAFHNCNSLAELDIPENVSAIGKNCFSQCNMTVTAPHRADYYGSDIFDNSASDTNVLWKLK